MMDRAASDATGHHQQLRNSSRRPLRPPEGRPCRSRYPSSSSSSASTSDLDQPTGSTHRRVQAANMPTPSSSRRSRDPRPTMDVKVLYTVDSSPSHTMVARMGRSVPVDVIRPAWGPPSPTHGQSANPSGSSNSASSRPRFGRVTLKACLSAICIASPELIFDRKKDYIIYAVDPEETFRAAQQRSPSGLPRSYSGRAASDSGAQGTGSHHPHYAESSKAGAASTDQSGLSNSPMLVGKGYFSWGLEEDGNGETIVSGKVRSEGTRTVYRDGEELEENIDVLEVVFRMKETQARSKDQYFNLVRGFAAPSSSVETSPPFQSRYGRQSSQGSSDSRSFRSVQLRSEPAYQPSRDRERRSPALIAQRSSRRSLAPAADVFDEQPKSFSAQGRETIPTTQASSRSSRSGSSPAKGVTEPPAPSAPPVVPAPIAAASASPTANPQALQLLSLLQTLQNHQAKPGQQAPAPQQQAQLSSLLGLVAGALGASMTGEAAEETSSTSRPPGIVLDSVEASTTSAGEARTECHSNDTADGKENQVSGQSSTKRKGASGGKGKDRATGNTPRGNDTSPTWSAVGAGDDTGDDADSRLNNTCYNCGTRSKTTWRTMVLPAGTSIPFPASEKPPQKTPSSAYVPQFADLDGPIEADGSCRWSACNPCGLYFLKYMESRPKHIWNQQQRQIKAKEKEQEALQVRKEGEKRSGSIQAEPKHKKRVKLSQTDDEPVSPAHSTNAATPNTSNGKSTCGSERKASLPRTLSEACQRDADRMETERLEKERKRELNRKSKEAQRMLMQDENGQWRSRRSIRENPSGRKAGRPKGSTKKAKALAMANEDGSPSTSIRSSPAAQREATKPSGKPKAPSSSNGDETVFRAPERPNAAGAKGDRSETSAAGSRSVTFAQSSPVRPSMPIRHSMEAFSDQIGHSAPFGSPSRDLRFGVPNYLLNSSPGTMMDTLMSEADFDFEELGPANLFSTPGSLVGLSAGLQGTPTPLRRSPRKNPHGTKSDQNPYATHIELASPSSASRTLNGMQLLNFSSDESPVTRSRTRSGQGVLHPALFSSSDSPTEGKQKVKSSSNVTSPISPSPKRVSKSCPIGANGKIKSSASIGRGQLLSPKVHDAARRQAVQSRANGKKSLLADGFGNEDEDDDEGSEEQLTKGPYRAGRRDGSAESQACPASPSLNRTVRKASRGLQPAINQAAADAARPSHLNLPPSSPPIFDHPTTESANFADVEVDGWGRTPSMREIFPTPSDIDWASDSGQASPAKTTGDATSGQQDLSNPGKPSAGRAQDPLHLQVTAAVPARQSASPSTALVPVAPAHVARRPLPATVEDASTTSGSSPEDEDSPEQQSNVFELFDDPYGLLAASGFGIAASGAGAGVSADAFGNVELHRSMEFGQHLNQFTQQGGLGVAAHVEGIGAVDGQAVVSSSGFSSSKPTSSAATGEATPTRAATVLGTTNTFTSDNMRLAAPSLNDMSALLSSFSCSNPDLAAIFNSPGKPKLSPQMIETILLSPRKARADGPASTTPSTLQVAAPASEAVAAGEQADGSADLLALLNNPEIQAMLAEFGDLPQQQTQATLPSV